MQFLGFILAMLLAVYVFGTFFIVLLRKAQLNILAEGFQPTRWPAAVVKAIGSKK